MDQPAGNTVRLLQNAVFLNIPYEPRYKPLYLAYIAGLVHLGFAPRVTLGLPSGRRRLDRILDEIQGCRYSIHDLSRVTLDRRPPFTTPRFNMPFELGLAVAWQIMNPALHTWFLFESTNYRIQKSLSDLNGTDPQIHGGQVSGVLRELLNVFRRSKGQPTLPEMMSTYNWISKQAKKVILKTGAQSLFEPSAFQDLCYEAKVAANMAAGKLAP